MNDYHSYHARVLEPSRDGKCRVRIVDRYYPGPDRPEYITLVVLSSEEAIELANELKQCSKDALVKEEKIKINKYIAELTSKTAKEAKEEAYAE